MKTYISMIILCLASIFTMNTYAEPAIVFQGDLCVVVLLPPEAEPVVLIGDKLHVTLAVSGNNEVPLAPTTVTCQGNHSELLEFAIIQRAPCFIPDTPFGDVFTEDGKAVFTPGGNWTAQCKFRRPKGGNN
jgi:hypothetical protein